MRKILPEEALGHFMSRVEVLGSECGCWIWLGGETSKGYGALRFRGKPMRAHHVSYILHHGEVPTHLRVCHTCDTPLCVNPAHLWLGTQLENIKDRQMKARQAVGERNARSLLTEAKVREIRGHFASGLSRAAIGRMVGRSFHTVSSVVKRLSWKHVA